VKPLRISSAVILALAGATLWAFAQPALPKERVVNYYNWSDYQDPTVLDGFTKETGIAVRFDTYDSNDTLEAKLLAGQSGYDVVVPSAYFLARQISAGIFQKLDKSKLPNLASAWPEIAKQLAVYDPGNQYAADYMWGTTGIGYNVKNVKAIFGPDAVIDSWDYVFNPDKISKFKDCGIHLLDSSDDIMPAALHYLHLDPNSSDPADLDKATKLLLRIRPFVRKFHSSEYLNALATGEICFVVGFSGDVIQAKKRAAEAKGGIEIGYSIPKEGAQLSAQAGSGGEEHQLRVLCQRRRAGPIHRQGDPRRPHDLSGRGHHGKALHHHRPRSEDAAGDQPDVDADQDRRVTARRKQRRPKRGDYERIHRASGVTARGHQGRSRNRRGRRRAGGLARVVGLCRLSRPHGEDRCRQYAGRPLRHRRPHRCGGAAAIDRQDLHHREPRRRRRQYRHGIRRAIRARRLHDLARDQRLFDQLRPL
jgi:putrescine transport system substrate-binding protein